MTQSHLPLARQLRPKKFNEVHAHDSVVQVLKKVLFPLRHHSFMLTGTRGLGKTTIGRLIAQSLVCQATQEDSDSCGKCDSCLRVQRSQHPDVLEIDGASKSKVEEIREIISTCSTSPLEGKYKLYLIDEVHMLSLHAFNALLKTLEEPPSHVVFILATTEIQKVPSTIRSRCLSLHLTPPTNDQLLNYLKVLCLNQNILFDEHILKILIDQAEGTYRDLLNILEYILVLSERDLRRMEILEFFHALSIDQISTIHDLILSAEIEKLETCLDKIFLNGISPQKLINQLMNYLSEAKTEISTASYLYCELSKALLNLEKHKHPTSYVKMFLLRLTLIMKEKKKTLMKSMKLSQLHS